MTDTPSKNSRNVLAFRRRVESAMRGEDVAAAAEQALANRFQQTYAELVVDPLATARSESRREGAGCRAKC
jgi:hypothetical protein